MLDPTTKEAVSDEGEVCFFFVAEAAAKEGKRESKAGNRGESGSGGSGGGRRGTLPEVTGDGIRPETRSGENQGFTFSLILSL